MSEKLKPCPFCGKEPVRVGFDATGQVVCCEDPACPGGTLGGHVNVWNRRPREERLTEVQRRDRACLFGIYKTNARLRAALEHAASYMVTLCMDRPVHEDGEVVGHWQTVDWLIGLRELAEESHSIALSSLPPSDMRREKA